MAEHKPKRLQPISLYPLTPEEALRKALNTPPPQHTAANGVPQEPAAKPKQRTKRKK
jgi:hypothetical protein